MSDTPKQTNAMQFEKRNFMGIELDVLVHGENLRFLATQVAEAAGLKHPKESVRNARGTHKAGRKLEELVKENCTSDEALTRDHQISLPKDSRGRALRSTTVLFTEAEVYAMLLRSHSPQTEPFRKWVTEEVLPTIRKTGKYDAAESENPIAIGVMDELAKLHVRMDELMAAIKGIQAPPAPVPSPYEGQPGVALCDPAGFDARTYRDLGEMLLPRPALDKLQAQVVLHMEMALAKRWDTEDGRTLKEMVSTQKRRWKLFPRDWLKQQLQRQFYTESLRAIIAQRVTS